MMLLNDTWHKAVFYREPLERFLSGFRSKCEPGHDADIFHCTSAFGTQRSTFVNAVQHLAAMDDQHKDADQSIDVHWQRQARFCGGLENTLQYYDTIEELKRDTAHEKVSNLLTKVGIPKPISATFPIFDSIIPPSKEDRGDLLKHQTNAGSSLKQYYKNPSMTNTVISHYLEDYLLFGIKAPLWAVSSLEHRPPLADREKNIHAR